MTASNISYRGAEGITKTFEAMFTDSNIPQEMSLSRAKVSYVVSDGLGPALHEILVKDIRISEAFSVHFDEASRIDRKKQLDIHIRYWSSHDQIDVAFVKAVTLGRATGDILSNYILDILDQCGLPLKQLLTLGSDGPNVNKTVFRLVNDKFKEVSGGKPLIYIGTCPLHIVNNAFGSGLEKYGLDTQEFAMDLHEFFSGSSVRMEDLESLQKELELEEHNFLTYSPTRWLTLSKVLERVVEQFSAVEKTWEDLKKLSTAKQPKSTAFRRIGRQLEKGKQVYVRMLFVMSIAKVFETFLEFFQQKEPGIHLLYDNMIGLTKKILQRFAKPEALFVLLVVFI